MDGSTRVFPEAAQLQIEQLVTSLQAILAGNLVGVYLHGSLAMGCFNPQTSDLDILVAVERGMTVETKRRIAELLLHLSTSPHPVEISILTRHDLDPWAYPTPFDFHYSEAWREQHARDLASGEWRHWNDPEHQRQDPDLAAHITMLRQRGICLHGTPVDQVFPPVPREHFLASILADFAEAQATITRNPVYSVLNLCRVYWYLLEKQISSKAEAGEWAAGYLEGEAREVVTQALALYRGKTRDKRFEEGALERFARNVGDAVRALLEDQGNPPFDSR